MTKITRLLRYPLKSHGREDVALTDLVENQAMPWDRVWAVAHDASQVDGTTWAPCQNFSRVSKAPELMAITCQLDEANQTLTLRHPKLDDLTFCPDKDEAAFLDWVKPIVPQNRALPKRILRLDKRGFTDSDFPSVTLCNMSSHRAVEQRLGQDLSIHRWRGNIWFDGAAPWEEFDWIGKDLKIGECVLRPLERTDRCLATTANPETGVRDADTLAALETWGHQDFSVRAQVIKSGRIQLDDRIEVLR